ncbi:hypothetical protein [Polyangium fumosum]|uniref:hypothetical protein n=1 Tax=Polyangium fumosum TaxID=889272 RepID=UPI00147924FB|nr:hypothetical protein [Polyangium fumosum]
MARIEPTPHAPAELVRQGFELSDAILDVVSDILMEIAREEEGTDEGCAVVG